MADPDPPRRRSTDRARVLVTLEPLEYTPRSRARRPFAAFAAQLLGQDGRRRGLRGGPEVLDAARENYLKTEYSGADDRRPPTGLIARKKV